MPAAIPLIPTIAAAGSSILGSITGKGAAKKQDKAAQQMMAQLQPLVDAILKGTQTGIAEGQTQIGRGSDLATTLLPFLLKGLTGEQESIVDLQNFYRPLATGDRRAIDAFLAPERRSINRGYSAVQNNISRFAPRGGGRVSAGINADVERQGKLSDLVFGARRTGAEGLGQIPGMYGDVARTGLGGVGQGFQGIATGLNAVGGQNTGGLFGLLEGAQNRSLAQNAAAGASTASLGKNLGGLLAQIFKSKSGGASKSIVDSPLGFPQPGGGGGNVYA